MAVIDSNKISPLDRTRVCLNEPKKGTMSLENAVEFLNLALYNMLYYVKSDYERSQDERLKKIFGISGDILLRFENKLISEDDYYYSKLSFLNRFRMNPSKISNRNKG